MTTKEFPTCDVLSTITGILMGPIGGVYEVLNFMTGEDVFTHQIPRISREATPVVLKLHPQLEATITEAEQVTQENYLTWLATWEERYGKTITVPQMTIAEHERIDALSELAEKVSPDKIVVVSP
ncbi:hypothetical protein [Mesorhizobium sp. M0203]|uniref:DUF7736 domain-containing protein n=1 Tax=Mesorhizobium sp. M0203 TaxID=2956912 RepID=UPI00333DAC1A